MESHRQRVQKELTSILNKALASYLYEHRHRFSEQRAKMNVEQEIKNFIEYCKKNLDKNPEVQKEFKEDQNNYMNSIRNQFTKMAEVLELRNKELNLQDEFISIKTTIDDNIINPITSAKQTEGSQLLSTELSGILTKINTLFHSKNVDFGDINLKLGELQESLEKTKTFLTNANKANPSGGGIYSASNPVAPACDAVSKNISFFIVKIVVEQQKRLGNT